MDLLLTTRLQLFEIAKVPHGKLLDMPNIPSNLNMTYPNTCSLGKSGLCNYPGLSGLVVPCDQHTWAAFNLRSPSTL